MVSVNINIGRKEMYFFGVFFVFLSVIGFSIAYGGSSPSDVGHSIGELEGVQKDITGSCAAGSSIRVVNDDGSVVCEVDDFGCAWVDMTTSTQKPGGANCASTNMVAYIKTSDATVGVTGFCKYTTTAGYGKVVYGYLETRNADNSEYDSDRVLVCQNDWYTATVGSANECGVPRTGIAQYMKCS